MLGFVRWKILVVTTGLNGMARIPPARAKFFKFFEQGTAFCCSYGDEFATVDEFIRMEVGEFENEHTYFRPDLFEVTEKSEIEDALSKKVLIDFPAPLSERINIREFPDGNFVRHLEGEPEALRNAGGDVLEKLVPGEPVIGCVDTDG